MAPPFTDFLLGFIVLYIGTIIRTTDGTSVTWFEPPPVEVISDHNLVHYASNTTELPLASTNIPLSWNFSLSSDLLFISLSLKLNGENIGVVPPAGGQAKINSPFDQRFSLNWIPNEKVTLTIFNVTIDDNGTFTCEPTLFNAVSGSNPWKSVIPVQVLVPPAITNISGNQTATEGDNVTLNCEAAVGNPKPRITWTKVSDNTSVVTFPLVISRQDEGYFRCTADNDDGNPATKDVFLTVHHPPNITYISGNQTANQTDSVTLRCLADGKPAARITWTRVSDNSTVTFPLTITGKGDEGAYTCTADNDVKDSFSKDTFIIVQNYSPLKPSLLTDLSGNTAVVDSPFNLTCSAEANPPPSYRFYRDETSLDTSAVEVYTTLVTERRSPVNYSCTPYNEYGEGPTGSITVKVHYPPVATVNETIKVPNGSVVVILCDVSGNPPPDIFWYEGKTVSDGRLINHETRLSIKVVSNETYICSANNSLGSVTARVDVVVVVVMKITFTIRDKHCKECKEVSEEKVRIETFRWLEPFGITDMKMNTMKTGCGSVKVYLELSFTQSVTVDKVVETLKNVANQSDFGGCYVDPKSIGETSKAVSATGAPTSATTEKLCQESFIKKADCSVNVVIVAVIAVVAVFLVAFVAGVIGWWIHKRRKCRKDPRIHHSESEVLHDQNDIEDGAYARVNGGYADSGPPSANGTAQPKEAGSNNTDVPAEQAAAAPPAYAVVDKSKKKDKDKQNIPDYAVVDKSKKKKKKPEVEDPYAEVEDPKKDKDKKTTDPSTRDYAMVDKSKKKKKETDENAYATVDKSKKSKKGQQKPKAPGEVLYADLGDFQPVQPLPTVSTSPEPLAPLKRPTPYQGTEYADITQFLKGNATLPEGQSTEMQPTYANAGGGQGAAANKENANTGGEGDIEPKETPM